MKPIKFDLPLNGTKIATLEQLEENLTPEIIGHFHSGKLAKWLRARSLTEQAEVVDALLAANNEREVQLFKSLCEVFVSEVDENDAREAINDYKMSLPASGNAVDEGMDTIKAEFKKKETVLEQKITELEKEKYNLTEETTDRLFITANLSLELMKYWAFLQEISMVGVSEERLETFLEEANYEGFNEKVDKINQKYLS